METKQVTAAGIVSMLESSRLAHGTEDELQRAIAHLLLGHEVAFTREVRLSRRDRVDFAIWLDAMMSTLIAVEVKVGGSAVSLVRQLARYAEHENVAELVVVGTRWQQLVGLPQTIGGKRLHVVRILGGIA